jgi:excisionase family DNA binding protein
MAKNPTPDLITSAEVCELLNIDKSTLSRWVHSGRLAPVYKMPGLRGGYLFDRRTIQVARKVS